MRQTRRHPGSIWLTQDAFEGLWPVQQKRKGRGAHPQGSQEQVRAALRFAHVPQKTAQSSVVTASNRDRNNHGHSSGVRSSAAQPSEVRSTHGGPNKRARAQHKPLGAARGRHSHRPDPPPVQLQRRHAARRTPHCQPGTKAQAIWSSSILSPHAPTQCILRAKADGAWNIELARSSCAAGLADNHRRAGFQPVVRGSIRDTKNPYRFSTRLGVLRPAP
jgi:hypothetical protein